MEILRDGKSLWVNVDRLVPAHGYQADDGIVPEPYIAPDLPNEMFELRQTLMEEQPQQTRVTREGENILQTVRDLIQEDPIHRPVTRQTLQATTSTLPATTSYGKASEVPGVTRSGRQVKPVVSISKKAS